MEQLGMFATGPPGSAGVGLGAAAGPPADAVSVVAQRLAGVAQELQALQGDLRRLDSVDWNSAAAAAFRTSLAEEDAAFTSTRRQVEAAVDALTGYCMYLRAAADPSGGAGATWRENPGIGPGWGGALGMGRAWQQF
ncbi:hypothetical protein AAGW05_08585 [Arthrobacter sp. LAPM80]|uniref:hypothetical protein n=1 Tax=Arthrobacter sp. LAPM80 TaxID=3141788 RepID=UPI00398B641E